MSSRKKKQFEPLPIDLAILARLPEEGTMLGFHHLGKQVRALKVELSEAGGVPVTSDEVSGRLRNMEFYGLTASQPAAQGLVWQRTERGKTLVQQRGEPTPGGGSDE